jgi:hypothetical protein
MWEWRSCDLKSLSALNQAEYELVPKLAISKQNANQSLISDINPSLQVTRRWNLVVGDIGSVSGVTCGWRMGFVSTA